MPQENKDHRCLGCHKAFDEIHGVGACWTDDFCSLRCAAWNWQCYAEVPPTFWQTKLEELKCLDQIAAVQGWIKSHEIGRSHNDALPGLLLYGAVSGTGKTRLGTYAASQVAGEWWSGEKEAQKAETRDDFYTGFWFSVGRFRERYLEVAKELKPKGDWMHQLSTCEVLFLDDVDKLKPSDGLLELLFSIIDNRLSNGATTILTTNLSGDSLGERWGNEYGPYLVRRLREFCLCLDFDVADAAEGIVASG